MSAGETDSNVRIALAGIAATAAVGLAGAAVTFVVARENRESSTELARLALVYNKRSQAYVDGLDALHTLRAKALINNYLALPTAWAKFGPNRAILGARIEAFGSPKAIDLYTKAVIALEYFEGDVEFYYFTLRREKPQDRWRYWKNNGSRRNFDSLFFKFERVVPDELQ